MNTLSLRTPRTLDDLLNYRLLRLFSVSGAPVIRLLEGRHGIARREWRLLALLAARGMLSPSALAEQAALDRPRTSRALGSLVAKGLVQRVPQPGDARRAQVTLTDAGRALHDEVFPQVAALNRDVVAALDDSAVQALDRALELLTARAQTLNAERMRDVRADRRAGGSRRVRPGTDG
ncbi:MarR family winged helix-turn-helix transcriptional regulator [Pseudorhodoferax sp.]|uniref:MarR family winged helix-turn-helix transcriptional regulator n=1 Tax=Pseudorhodoferax sp. TaxID=1993553 RepID=UPI002DD68B3B|nr:MarR family transcriptional regulator [Pseudorhodoferax sp.]